MNDKICIFAGTRDGRELAEYLSSQGLDVTACSATEYGGELLEASHLMKVRSGRMDEEEMKAFFDEEDFCLIIDATHPYAQIVTQNIREAAKASEIEYLRLLRAQEEVPLDAVYLEDTEEAVKYLSGTEGQILLTTGSKELSAYAQIPGFSDRVWARVLPLMSSLKQAEEAGLPAGRIIGMQGPISQEMNEAMIRMTGARYLVSKMSGKIGGFGEKMDAAKACGITAVVIGRPPEEEGMNFRDMTELISKRFGLGKDQNASDQTGNDQTGTSQAGDGQTINEKEELKVEDKTPCAVKNADKVVTEYIFDENALAVKHRLFYMCTEDYYNSEPGNFHSTQNFILQYENVKFFDRW